MQVVKKFYLLAIRCLFKRDAVDIFFNFTSISLSIMLRFKGGAQSIMLNSMSIIRLTLVQQFLKSTFTAVNIHKNMT